MSKKSIVRNMGFREYEWALGDTVNVIRRSTNRQLEMTLNDYLDEYYLPEAPAMVRVLDRNLDKRKKYNPSRWRRTNQIWEQLKMPEVIW